MRQFQSKLDTVSNLKDEYISIPQKLHCDQHSDTILSFK